MAGQLIIRTLLAGAALCACTRTVPVTDLERYQLQGNVLCALVQMEAGVSYCAWFNRQGMLDSLVQMNPSDTLSNVFHYDREGKLTEHEIFRQDRHYEGYYLYQYKKGVLSSYSLFGWDLQAIFDWKFDIEDGHQTRCRYYNEGALVSTTEYTYGEHAKMETIYDAEGALCGEITYTYRDAFRIDAIRSEDIDIRIEYGEDLLPASSTGGLIEPDGEIAGARGAKVSYTYEKDNRGNWTSRTETISGEAGRTITRTITYR